MRSSTKTSLKIESKRMAFHKALLVLVFAILGYRILALINHHAVNILYWDQWGFMQPMFEGRTWWNLFRWQHGPWRQGAGIISYLIADLTNWDSRIESFAIGVIICLAAAAALWLKHRLFGSLNAYDAVIPLTVMTMAQFQTLVGPVSTAPTALPLLLILLYCLSWTIRHKFLQYSLVLFFNFLAVNTGYSLFIGAISLSLFALEIWRQREHKTAMVAALCSLIIAVLTIVEFTYDYNSEHLTSSVHIKGARFWEYPLFAAFMFGRFIRPEIGRIGLLTYLAMIVGIGLFVMSMGVIIWHLKPMLAGDSKRRKISLTIFILVGYTLIYSTGTALGRAPMGLNVSQSSRFVTLMVAGFLGLYLHLLTIERDKLRATALILFLLLLLPGHLPLRLGESHPASFFSANKRAWKDCYLRTEDVAKCQSLSDFKLLPDPNEQIIKWLQYLKKHQLNLYADKQ